MDLIASTEIQGKFQREFQGQTVIFQDTNLKELSEHIGTTVYVANFQKKNLYILLQICSWLFVLMSVIRNRCCISQVFSCKSGNLYDCGQENAHKKITTLSHQPLEDARWCWHCLGIHSSSCLPSISHLLTCFDCCWYCCCCSCCCWCDRISFHKGKIWPPPPRGFPRKLQLETQSKPENKSNNIQKISIQKHELEKT